MPHALLFELLAGRDLDVVATQIRRFGRSEWRHFVELAVQQKCAPWVHGILSSSGLGDSMSAEARLALARALRFGAARNMHALRSLQDIALRVAPTTPLLVLKGARLARTHYAHPALRPMLDVDLLARPEHIAGVTETLLALGYVAAATCRPHHARLAYHEIAFSKASMKVELHRSLLDEGSAFSIDHDALWDRAVPSGEGCLWYLALEDQLLHVCLHAAYHHEFQTGIYAFRDIALMCADPRLDAPAFVERAREWGAERCAYLTLMAAQRVAGAVLPADFQALRPYDYCDEVLKRTVHSIVYSLDLESLPRDRFIVSELIARLCTRQGWRTLPRTLIGRFILPASRRARWSEDSSSSWGGQLAPLLRGLPQVLFDRTLRRRVRARVLGKRASGWMQRRGTPS